eukprot:COSAG02_NODE_5743_length_4073_cov_47.272771_2_plen_300_part_00
MDAGTFMHTLLRSGLTAKLQHIVCSDGRPAEASVAAGADDDWGVLAGAAVEWSCSHKDGKYAHESAVELPLGDFDGASIVATSSAMDGDSYAVRYEHPGGLRAVHFGVNMTPDVVNWGNLRDLPYAAGWRHGALAAGLRGTVDLADSRASTNLAPAARLAFDDQTVSALLFVEGQQQVSIGGCCRWRPSFAPRIKLSCGLRYAVDVEDSSSGPKYNVTMDEGVVTVQHQVDDSLSAQLRVRRCFGLGCSAQQSAVQYSVRKRLTDGFSVGLVWQSPLSSVARYSTHSVGFNIAGGQSSE